jgi:HSP20 family protein
MTLIRPELMRSGHLDSWLRDFLWNDESLRGLWELSSSRTGGPATGLAADFYEDKDAYHAFMELPGVSKGDLEVELENAVLTVRGKYTSKEGDREETYEFSRSLGVPESVDAERIAAEMRDGLLVVTMPKAEARKPRAIEVR